MCDLILAEYYFSILRSTGNYFFFFFFNKKGTSLFLRPKTEELLTVAIKAGCQERFLSVEDKHNKFNVRYISTLIKFIYVVIYCRP